MPLPRMQPVRYLQHFGYRHLLDNVVKVAAIDEHSILIFNGGGVLQGCRGFADRKAVEEMNEELAEVFGQHAKAGMPTESLVPTPAGAISRLTHVDGDGAAVMVDVAAKPVSARSATASARVLLGAKAYSLLEKNQASPKGNVLLVAQLAGIQAAKATSNLIPLCHSLPLDSTSVTFQLEPARKAVRVLAEAKATGRTGVEMEAMTAAAVASLTIYDMVKAAAKGVEIQSVRLERKDGGRSGSWKRAEEDDEI